MCHYPPRYMEGSRVRVIRHGSSSKYAKEGVVVQMFGGLSCGVFDVVFDGDTWRTTCDTWDTIETIREKVNAQEENNTEAKDLHEREEAEVDLRSILQEAWRRRSGVPKDDDHGLPIA